MRTSSRHSALTTLRVGQRDERNLGRRLTDLDWRFLIVPTLVVDHTELALRQGGVLGEETFLVWAGTIAGEMAFVSTLVVPDIESHETHGEVGPRTVAAILETLDRHDLVALAQVHSHPRRAFLSRIDERSPIAVQAGFVSIVVPRFGFVDLSDTSTWSMHEYRGGGRWRTFEPDEIRERVIVDPSLLSVT